MKHKIKTIHFIGIGGVGMSGIAEVLFNLGYLVSGSDVSQNSNTDRLSALGIKIYIGHCSDNLVHVDVVVISTAISNDNPELLKAREMGITIVPRAMMLAELMRFKYGIAIAGTHGKTTTTSLCAEVLSKCNLDPTFIIGGRLAVTGSNAKIGSGDFLIAEADESDASFLFLNPLISVITNIDLDHMDTYDHDENKLKQAFIDFVHRLPFYGCAILCAEDERIKSIIPHLNRQVITYGFSDSCNIYAKDIKANKGKMNFTVHINGANKSYPVELNLPGVHNVLNALAVIAVALECECKIDKIAQGLSEFHGVGRRSQSYPDIQKDGKTALLIDDYGHHPSEIKATLNAMRGAYPDRRMIVVFQPHRYTRTRDLFDDFVSVLAEVDYLIVMEVYAAGEKPIPLADGKSLVRSIRLKGNQNVVFAENLEDAQNVVLNTLQDGDLVLTIGAGSISKLPQMFCETR